MPHNPQVEPISSRIDDRRGDQPLPPYAAILSTGFGFDIAWTNFPSMNFDCCRENRFSGHMANCGQKQGECALPPA
jgi:hypothetical protein